MSPAPLPAGCPGQGGAACREGCLPGFSSSGTRLSLPEERLANPAGTGRTPSNPGSNPGTPFYSLLVVGVGMNDPPDLV